MIMEETGFLSPFLISESMNRTISLVVFLLVACFCKAGDVVVTSPDGKMQVKVSDAGGRLYYSVTYDGQDMLLPSALGLKTSMGDLTRDLSITASKTDVVNEQYTMRGTKASTGNYNANALTISLKNKDGVAFDIRFQVSNNDIAFRYEMARQKWQKKDMKRVRILSEASSFNFPDGTTTFISPQIGPESGWEQTKPS
jgi:hypothetical protein